MRRNQVVVLVLSLAAILALGILDYVTAFDLELFLFYAIPVASTAWVVGRWAAVGMAMVAVGVWFTANVLWTNPCSSSFYAAWNTALHAGWILLMALTLAQIRADLDRERRLNADLAEAQNEVTVLQGLLPICAWCHRIRNAEGQWETLEAYIRRHTDAEFTHGICQGCKARLEAEGR
jgi:hypothetical protein